MDELRVTDTGIPFGVMEIVEELPDCESLEPGSLVLVKFSNNYVFRTGLVLLAAWRKTLPPGVGVALDTQECQEPAHRLIENCGLRDLVEVDLPAPNTTIPNRVPIQPLLRGEDVEKTVGQIVNVFADQNLDEEAVMSVKTALSELCENAYSHSDFESPAYVSAGVHQERCEIAICDTGIGVLESYLSGTNDEAKARLAGGESALQLAIEDGVSSKPTPLPGEFRTGYGYGLFVVRRLVERNRGRLTIISGDECLNIQGDGIKRYTLKRPWQGTYVGVVLNLQQPLSLDDVYKDIEELEVPSATAAPVHSATVFSEQPVPENPEMQNSPRTSVEIPLARFGTQLLTREIGLVIRAEIATVLASGVDVVVRLGDIEDLTPSVADECFGKLVEAMGEEVFQQRIQFTGGQPVLKRLLDLAIRRRTPKD